MATRKKESGNSELGEAFRCLQLLAYLLQLPIGFLIAWGFQTYEIPWAIPLAAFVLDAIIKADILSTIPRLRRKTWSKWEALQRFVSENFLEIKVHLRIGKNKKGPVRQNGNKRVRPKLGKKVARSKTPKNEQ